MSARLPADYISRLCRQPGVNLGWLGLAGMLWVMLIHGSLAQVGPGAKVKDRTVALCIGINSFENVHQNNEAPTLRFAEDDAREIANLLKNRYGYEVETMLGASATKSNIQARLFALTSDLKTNDSFIIYVGCHGVVKRDVQDHSRGFILPYDARSGLARATVFRDWAQEANAIDMTELARVVRSQKCLHTLLILDSCHAGWLGDIEYRDRSVHVFDGRSDLQTLWLAKSSHALAACGGDEKSPEPGGAEGKHGYFAEALLRVLETDSLQSITEVLANIRSSIRTHPEFKNDTVMPFSPQLYKNSVASGEFVFVPKESFIEADGGVVANVIRRLHRFVFRGIENIRYVDFMEAANAMDYRFAANATEQKKDWEIRLKEFEDAAAKTDPLAYAALYFCYSKGLGTDKNPQMAYRWARQAFDAGIPEGSVALALAHLQGEGTVTNIAAGLRLLRTEVDQPEPNPLAMTVFALKSLPDRPSVEDFEKAWKLLSQAAQSNLIPAQVALARLQLGWHPDYRLEVRAADRFRDPTNAFRLLSQLEGNPVADYLLATTYLSSPAGYPQPDQAKARQLALKSAEGGYARAQSELAAEYYKGTNGGRLGLGQDVAQAIFWGETAAAQGDANAHLTLAEMYLHGVGVIPDFAVARDHLEQAVSRNFAPALWTKGVWSAKGTAGYSVSEEEAMRNYERAASIEADYALRLARMCIRLDWKLKWYGMAARYHDYLPAQDELLFLLDHLRGHRIWEAYADLLSEGSNNRSKDDQLRKIAKGIAAFNDEYYSWVNALAASSDGWLARGRRNEAARIFGDYGIVYGRFGSLRGNPIRFPGPGAYSYYSYKRAGEKTNAAAQAIIQGNLAEWYLMRAARYENLGLKREAAWACIQAANTEAAKSNWSEVALTNYIDRVQRAIKDCDPLSEPDLFQLLGIATDFASLNKDDRWRTYNKVEFELMQISREKASPEHDSELRSLWVDASIFNAAFPKDASYEEWLHKAKLAALGTLENGGNNSGAGNTSSNQSGIKH